MRHGAVQGDIHVQHLSVLRLPPSPGGRWDLHGAGGGAGLCPRKRGTAPGPGRLSSPATPSAENRKLAGNAAHLWGTRPGATTCPQPSLWPCVPHLQRAAAPCWQGSRAPAAPACGHRTRHSPPPGLAPGPWPQRLPAEGRESSQGCLLAATLAASGEGSPCRLVTLSMASFGANTCTWMASSSPACPLAARGPGVRPRSLSPDTRSRRAGCPSV